jgi:hypothetical protein
MACRYIADVRKEERTGKDLLPPTCVIKLRMYRRGLKRNQNNYTTVKIHFL